MGSIRSEEKHREYTEFVRRLKQSVSIEQALSHWGYDTSHTNRMMYHSPFVPGGDSNPSFIVYPPSQKQQFEHYQCFATNQRGSSVIDLGVALGRGTQKDVIEDLSSLIGVRYDPTEATLDTMAKGADHGRKMQDTVEEEPRIYKQSLIEYMETGRRIPLPVLRRYCRQVRHILTYEDGTKKTIQKIGFMNRSGGWALRTPGGGRFDKTTYSKSDITFYDSTGEFRTDDVTPSSDRVVIFEGFTNFLSWMAWRNEAALRGEGPWNLEPGCDVIVLNSVSNCGKAAELLDSYGEVILYLDNDAGGIDASVELAALRCKSRGIELEFTPEEVEWVRERVRERVDADARGTAEVMMQSGVDGTPEELYGRSRLKAVEGMHIVRGTVDDGSLERYLGGLTPQNIFKAARVLSMRPFVHRVVMARLSSSLRDGAVVASPLASALGMHSLSYDVYGGFDDMNDAWKERCGRILAEMVERRALEIASGRGETEGEGHATTGAEDRPAVPVTGDAPSPAPETIPSGVPQPVADSSADPLAVPNTAFETEGPLGSKEQSENKKTEKDMEENEKTAGITALQETGGSNTQTAALDGPVREAPIERSMTETPSQAEGSPAAGETEMGTAGNEASLDNGFLRRREENESTAPEFNADTMVKFEKHPYEPDSKDLEMLANLDWYNVMRMMGQVYSQRMPAETREAWVERNRDIFVDKCRRTGPGVIEAMVRGGYTSYPLHVDVTIGSAGRITGYFMMRFNPCMGDPAKFAYAMYPVAGIGESVKRVCSPAGDFLYYDHSIENTEKQDVSRQTLFRCGNPSKEFSEEQKRELRSTGRLSRLCDPATLLTFANHTDSRSGKTYELDADRNLCCDGKVEARWENASLMHVCRWDCSLVEFTSRRTVEDALKRAPCFRRGEGQQVVSLSDDQVVSLACANDVDIVCGGERIKIHWDASRGCLVEGKSFSQVEREILDQERVSRLKNSAGESRSVTENQSASLKK